MLRSHNCGSLTVKHLKKEVQLSGWVSVLRDHGGVNFIDLRDRWGVTQVVFRPELDKKLHALSKQCRPEFCIWIKGEVNCRPEGTVNAKIPTGEIEVTASELKILSQSQTPPFDVLSEEKFSEELRLKYRYLDIRRPSMLKNLVFRSRLVQKIRCLLHAEEFLEVETPILTKSTPEGARDYLVPSRLNPGQFYALPQSPQLFKQLLMVSGADRYFQIAKCFRDEDLRADRQPEFTQLDLEMSFAEEEDIFKVIESLMKALMEDICQKKIKLPFLRLSHEDALSRFGTDKPDLRFDLSMKEVSEVFKKTSLKVFQNVLDAKGAILMLHVPKPKITFSRKDFDDLITFAKSKGAKGLAYMCLTQKGWESPISKFLTAQEWDGLKNALGPDVTQGDMLFFAADTRRKARSQMGQVRLELSRRLQLIPKDSFSFVWVDQFPLFKFNDETKRWENEHHPFTGIHADDIRKLGQDNQNIRSLSYDLVLNGNEIASGSIRIHDAGVQKKIFEIIGLSAHEAQERFGFLLDAFKYGPPPHGGIAIGIDRLVAICLGLDSIRDIVAFPKTQKAICPMTDAPSPVDAHQLKELGIKVR